MDRLKCLIVEDEPLAAEVLEDYIAQLPKLKHIATCQDAIYALDKLNEEEIDLIFLDIHLPKLKGLDFLRTLTDPPKVIITSAYHQYAIEGFDLNVVDYLLKPIEFSRFLKAVNKAMEKDKPLPSIEKKEEADTFHFFNVNKKKVKVFEKDILVIESLKEYVRIITDDKKLLTKMQIGEMEQLLDTKSFIRPHRSYIVALDKIEAYTSSHLEIKSYHIPIGRTYRNSIIKTLENL